jgi:glycosyl transferase family 25
MFEFIDKVVYINLDSREDRRQSILKQLEVFPSEKVLRFSAIKESNGAIGCTKSHIAVVKMAIQNKWKNVLILEDDAIWNNIDEGHAVLEKLVAKPYDVIALGITIPKYDSETYKLYYGCTTTAYLVDGHYYETLLDNYETGLTNFLATGIDIVYALDRYWEHLMKRDNWYCVIPCLMYQASTWSDIQNRFMSSWGSVGVDSPVKI